MSHAPTPTAPTPTSSRRGPDTPTGRVGPVIAVLVIAAFVMILNETVLSVALPPLMQEFSVPATTAQWLTTGFMLTMAVVIPTTGFLIRRFSTRGLFGTALALFLVGTVVAALAPSFALVLLARVVQAGGTAIILPLLMTTTLTSVAPQHRGTIMGLNSIVISVGPAVGPTLSGIVVDLAGWRSIFWVMLPIAALTLVAGALTLRANGETARARMDVWSVALSAVAFGGIVYALASIGAVLEGAWIPLAAAVIGVAALVMFARRQGALSRSAREPLLSLRPFAVPTFRTAVLVVMMCMATMLGAVIVLPIYLQDARGVSVLATGLLLLPGGLIQGIISPIAGRLYDRIGAAPVLIPGAVLLAGGQWMLATIGADTPLWLVVVLHVVFCAGMAALMPVLMTMSLSSLPREQYPYGSAIVNTLQQLAGAAGTALFVAALTIGAALAADGGTGASDALVAGTRGSFVVGGILGLVAFVAVFFLRPRREAPATH